MLYRNHVRNMMGNMAGSKTIQGVPPLTLPRSSGKELKDYEIYGNSQQSTTPQIDTPVEIESVGDKTKNLVDFADITLNKYSTYAEGTAYAQAIDFFKTAEVDKKYTMSARYKLLRTGGANNMRALNSSTLVALFISGDAEGKTRQHSTFTVTSNYSTITRFIIYAGNSGDSLGEGFVKELQVEEGETATDYEPYGKYKIPIRATDTNNTDVFKTNIYLNEPLRKIGDFADYIDFKQQKIIRYTKEIILTGTESWQDFEVYSDRIVASVPLSDLPIPNNTPAMSNRYAYNGTIASANNGLGQFSINDSLNLTFNVSEDNVEKIKAWLAANPTKIVYKLDSPVEEEIVLPKILTAKGTTELSVDTKLAPSNMLVKYITR